MSIKNCCTKEDEEYKSMVELTEKLQKSAEEFAKGLIEGFGKLKEIVDKQ